MISRSIFDTLPESEQKQYLLSVLSSIETTTNKVLLVCQKLLKVVVQPSKKLLQFIFDTILEQLHEYKTATEHAQRKKTKKLLLYIATEEQVEKESLEDIIAQIEHS